MATQGDLIPISGLSAERLQAITRHLGLACKGPNAQELMDEMYVGWACSGSISADDPASLITFDFMGIDTTQIVSVSGQVHASPKTQDFPDACRRVVGFILAALDEPLASQARDWLDDALVERRTGKMAVSSIVFDFMLQTERSLSFDIHSDGF